MRKTVSLILLGLVCSVGMCWGAINNTTVTKAGGSQKYIDVSTTAASAGDEVTVSDQYIAYTVSELVSNSIKGVWYTQSSGSSGSSDASSISITGYRSSNSKYINISSSNTHTFYVTNCKSFAAIYDPRAGSRYLTIEATNVDNDKDVLTKTNEGTVSSGTYYNVCLDGLEASKYYLVVIKTNNSSNSRLGQIRLECVSDKTPSSLALSSDAEVEIGVSSTSQITTTGAAGTVTYKSNDVSVATVSSTGLISAVSGGKTTITVSDPGTAEVAAGSVTVTVLVPYANPSAADSYTLDNSQYGFSNTAGNKWYFKNGFTISNANSKTYSSVAMGDKSGAKYSANVAYTIAVPSSVTVTFAEFKARNNYGSDKDAANWGTIFGTDYSATNLPWSNEDPAEKDATIASPSAGGTLAFTPKGNQWQAIVTLHTDEYHEKYSVSYDKGEGTGSMSSTTARGSSTITLPASTFTAPSGYHFSGWNDGDNDYKAGDSYTMPEKNVTLTAQWAIGTEETITYVVKVKNNDPSTTPSTHLTNLVNETNVGIADVTDQSKTDRSGKYATSSTAGYGVNFSFDVASGYTFRPTSISLQVATVSTTDFSFVVYLTDSKGTVLTSNTLNSFSGDGVLTDITFPSYNKVFAPGTVNMLVTAVRAGGAGEYRIGKTITIKGIVQEGVAVGTKDGRHYGTYVTANKLDFASADGIEAYIATGLNGAEDAVTLRSVDIVPSGTPIIVKTDETGAFACVPISTAEASDVSANKLVAGDGMTAWDGTTGYIYYYLASDQFHYANAGTLQSGKAYLKLPGETSAPSIIRIIDEENTATDIESIEANEKAVKFFENGQLYILRDGITYDAIGRKIR